MHYGPDFSFRFRLQDDSCAPGSREYDTWAGLLTIALSSNTVRASYSVDKFLAMPLFAAIIPTFFPLKHPREGITVGYYLNGVSIIFSTSLGALLHWTAATDFTSADFSFREKLAMCVVAVVINVPGTLLIYSCWEFPVPFSFVILSPLFFFNLSFALVVVVRRRLWTHPVFKRSLDLYGACMNLQVAQIIIYPAISVLYDKVGNTQRILLTTFFPIIKYGLKRLIKRAGKRLGEYQTVVAVSGVEICASLYQSMIMQTVPSTVAIGIIMGLDVVQGMLAIKFFADRHVDPSVPRDKIFDEAESVLTTKPVAPDATTAKKYQSDKQLRVRHRIVTHALQLANTAESILLVEYYEVIVPIVNGLFLLVAAQFHSARYNSRIAPFYHDRDQLASSLFSLTLYSLLQGLSCVAMHFVMKYRYGVSAIAHLSFVLERYHQSILGMMLAWLPVILHFTLMHYGSDFTFRFHFQDDYW
ncbi:hypothetical protein Poli38472_007867 [Pythium oligandrum]|uniref:Uncharacterized protein n=1 Tax=Pythium oligandrum TaxID=41045 RepID=A0A8K1CT24_PYTOL|nr:hypothetical protein Poli38472_007867 [Pythium oligandrum]|eukprot:TMW68195.1 hypothetical protein Poli38472_007867 [Pythium oligandrum]